MKYLIMMYGSQRDYDLLTGTATDGPELSPEDFAPMHSFMESFTNDLVESGELVETRGLAAPVLTRRVRIEGGVPVVTDGPYAEAEEVLSGYWVVECESFDRATEIAARLGDCPSPGDVFAASVADVRPILDGVGDLEA
ncbi:MAG TPA: YciI family protein [Acidimicrobiales bacterium]|nr:YciI family protein [Acidimicrobiales bacterium]